MSNFAKFAFAMACPMFLGLSSCKGEERRSESTSEAVKLVDSPGKAIAFPDSLPVIGDGFPDSGDACRQLGENDLTRDWMDESSILVGCPTRMDARQLGGNLVGAIEGVTVVAVDKTAHEMRMVIPVGVAANTPDALVKGTGYNATALVPCAFDAGAAKISCPVGVRRDWGSDGTTLVEVTKPDGRKRAIYFRGVKAFGADSEQADGSAAYDFNATRKGDESLISFGPERYVVPDELVGGG